MKSKVIFRKFFVAGLALGAVICNPLSAFARNVDYKGGEVGVNVNPGEPTQIKFPGTISGGFKKKSSSLSLDRKDTDLVIFANEKIPTDGEAIIVRLNDGRSYSLRVNRATPESPRDDVVTIVEKKEGIVTDEEEETPPYKEKKPDYAPPTQVSGLMREMMLVSEFGKKAVPGYKQTDVYKGQTVLNDGTVHAAIETIFIGSNLWGYVINAKNLLDQTQRINPASFRIDGTRAISARDWELAPRPVDIEQQISDKHETKIYIVTRAK
jgi:hypothetical protein